MRPNNNRNRNTDTQPTDPATVADPTEQEPTVADPTEQEPTVTDPATTTDPSTADPATTDDDTAPADPADLIRTAFATALAEADPATHTVPVAYASQLGDAVRAMPAGKSRDAVLFGLMMDHGTDPAYGSAFATAKAATMETGGTVANKVKVPKVTAPAGPDYAAIRNQVNALHLLSDMFKIHGADIEAQHPGLFLNEATWEAIDTSTYVVSDETTFDQLVSVATGRKVRAARAAGSAAGSSAGRATAAARSTKVAAGAVANHVRDHLVANPGTWFGTNDLAKVLPHSSGAIGTVMFRLGDGFDVTDTPRVQVRYVVTEPAGDAPVVTIDNLSDPT